MVIGNWVKSVSLRPLSPTCYLQDGAQGSFVFPNCGSYGGNLLNRLTRKGAPVLNELVVKIL
jgi:hypothetical protein